MDPAKSIANAPPGGGLCLILGAGGVRGFAHLGVLQRLEEEGIRPSSLVGCSVGGLVAAYYAAAGFGPREMLELGERLSTGALLAHAWAHWSRGKGRTSEGIAGRLLRRIAGCSFRNLHRGIRYLGISAFDLVTRRTLLFTGWGETSAVTVAEAAIGGAAIPFLFPPKKVRHGDRKLRLMDAGFLAAVPLEEALASPIRATTAIVVDLSIRFGLRRQGPRYWGSMRRRLGPRLIRLRPRLKRFGTVLFLGRDIPEIVEAGRAAVTPEVLERIRQATAEGGGSPPPAGLARLTSNR